MANVVKLCGNLYRNECQKTKLWIWTFGALKMRKPRRSEKILQHESLLAQIGFDTAENEPSKDCYRGKFVCPDVDKLYRTYP